MASCRLHSIFHLARRRPSMYISLYNSLRTHSSEPKSDLVTSNTHETVNLDPLSRVDESQQEFLENLCPPAKRSFNFAAYVNRSETLQELLKLGVSLFDIENIDRDSAKNLNQLNFETDVAPYVKLLVDSGVKNENLGRFITQFPAIFKTSLDDLQVRINYLESKGFSKSLISQGLNKSPVFLKYNVKTLDYKLGIIQVEFNLSSNHIRKMVANHPDVLALPDDQYKLVNFTLAEEFGFTYREMHSILTKQPKVVEFLRPKLIERLDYLHNTIGISHKMLAHFPGLITGPIIDIRHRHQYLKKLKRDQFDPSKPLFIPASALYYVDDETFCHKYCKTSLEDYKLFLRSY